MTKKKPSPQNRIWEKERRDRLNQTFDSLSKLLPEYEPATQLSKIEVLQRTIEYVEKLQDKIKAFLEERDTLLKKHVDELEERLQVLIARNEDLAALLKKSNINVPPCKLASPISGKDSPVGKQDASPLDPAKSSKKPPSKQKKASDKEDSDRKAGEASGKTDTNSVIENISSVSSDISTAVSTSEIVSKSVAEAVAVVTVSNVTATALPVAVTTSVSGTCLVMANNQIVGTLKQSNGVNVTPALLPTPIMATGVIISNNGNLLQMPLAVPPTSSLLIVSNEDVRSKLSLRKTRGSGSSSKPSSSKTNSARKGKFTIKSIDVIPGRIVNGKIPIPPLKRPPPTGRSKKETRKKRRKRKASEQKENEEIGEAKKAKLNDSKSEEVVDEVGEVPEVPEAAKQPEVQPTENVIQVQERQTVQVDDRASSLEINLDQGDLTVDIFANLQVPDEEPDVNQGSLSPTAAYLMNFPLVSTGGKASGNHVEGAGEVEPTDCVEGDKKTSQQTPDTSLLLDNFSSYFNPTIYAGLDSVIQPIVEIPVTSVAVSSSFSTIYQSIDSMIEHKTPRVTVTSDCRYNTTPFTFTLTSTSNTITTQSYDYRHASSSNYFYPTAASATKPIDDFGLPKLPIVSEFTFSLTSTIQSGPKTVQSQYTNSTIFSSTITTPSYSTYGYQTKASKTANYNSNYFPEVSKPESKTPKKYDFLEAEKPATSFTFSLTSTTKTNPKNTYPPVVASSSSYTTPYVTTSASSCAKIEDCLYKASKSSVTSQNLYKTPPKQKVNHYPVISTVQSTFPTQTSTHSQSKYDVNWMTSQDPKPSTNNQDYSQLLPSLEFNTAPSHTYQTNIDLSRKSDIFFAHPSGEENLVTWSPNKLTNILNDTTSSYYPSTTTSLPNLHGDLALNCPLNTNKPIHQQRKPNDSCSTFLSVQQLVDQPRKSTTSKNYSSCSNYSTNQKPLNNNYSAESLIGTSTGSSSKKDKFYTDTSYNSYSTYQPEVNSGAGLSFNFDYSTDYSKNYNYSCQQNYMPSFVDNSYGLSTISSATLTTPSSSSFPVTSCYAGYGYPSDKKQSSSSATGSYYQNSSYQSGTVPDIPYYVPATEKRTLPSNPTNAKPKKHHKQPLPSTDYSSLPSSFPTILPPPPSLAPAPTLDDPLSGYNVVTTTSYQQSYQATMPNYSFGSQPYQPSPVASAAVVGGSGSSSTLTNFNLSTICPEINEKRGPSNNGGGPAAVIGGTVSARHTIAGVGGW
ncbi:mucin-4-like [Ochlerotatus camptorhynchus]|uniref:mucin-4-like n=1 Tax=Ochlerotatus camptorhynchus TaxID=644619 RepID=UPI0031CE9F31